MRKPRSFVICTLIILLLVGVPTANAEISTGVVKLALKQSLLRIITPGVGVVAALLEVSFVYSNCQAPIGPEHPDSDIKLDGSLIHAMSGPQTGTSISGIPTSAEATATARTGGWIFGPSAIRRVDVDSSGPDAFAVGYAKAGVTAVYDSEEFSSSLEGEATVVVELDFDELEFQWIGSSEDRLATIRITDLAPTEVSSDINVPDQVLEAAGLSRATPQKTYFYLNLYPFGYFETGGQGILDPPLDWSDFEVTHNSSGVDSMIYVGGPKTLEITVPLGKEQPLSTEIQGDLMTFDDGFLHADGFEGGDTSAWTTTIP